jgi:hypothetical protein
VSVSSFYQPKAPVGGPVFLWLRRMGAIPPSPHADNPSNLYRCTDLTTGAEKGRKYMHRAIATRYLRGSPKSSVRNEDDCVAGVGGLELGNVALQKAWPNSLVFQTIFVPETFRAPPAAEERSSYTRTGGTQVPPLLALSWSNGQNLLHLTPDALSALGLLGVGMRRREATKLLPCA